MKKVLFATTALVATAAAGAAFADDHVSLSVSADIGLFYYNGDTRWNNDFDLSWSASTVTDGGLTVAASGSADDADNQSVSIAGGFGKLAIGDVDDGMDAALPGVPSDPTSGDDVASDVANEDVTDGGLDGNTMLYTSPELGGATVFFSYNFEGQTDGEGDAVDADDEAVLGFGVKASVGDMTVGAGLTQDADDNYIGVGADFGILAVQYRTGEVGDADVSDVDLGGEIAIGAGTFGANYSMDIENDESNGYGAWYTQGLGGGVDVTVAAWNTGEDGGDLNGAGINFAASF